MVMAIVGILESISALTCFGSFLIWVSIGTLSRSAKSELFAQKVMTILCFAAAGSLMALYFAGGDIFGSANSARVLAVVTFVVGISASLNIKGHDVQGEANPHEMMKAKREAQEEAKEEVQEEE